MATVSAAWSGRGLGGMEHHPFFHVARPSVASEVVQAHEAAHGWFGNGVRIRCWEDFVLSEGVTTYLAARALGAAGGPALEREVWDGYAVDLRNAVSRGDTEAWPTTCNEIDILEHPIWSSIPYVKGAFFLRAVELEIGTATLDAALAAFYQRYGGREAASMSDLIATIEERSGFDTSELVETWLRSRGLPEIP
jgi:aminopeptidase N